MRSILLCLLVALLLTACGGSGPKKRVFPPQARIHELQVDDAGWQLQLRLHNFSTVPMTFSEVDATIAFGDVTAATIALRQPVEVAANSVELVRLTVIPTAEGRQRIDQALAAASGIEYRLDGRIVSSDPRGRHPFEFASRLDRVPGLDRVLR